MTSLIVCLSRLLPVSQGNEPSVTLLQAASCPPGTGSSLLLARGSAAAAAAAAAATSAVTRRGLGAARRRVGRASLAVVVVRAAIRVGVVVRPVPGSCQLNACSADHMLGVG